MTKKEGTSYLHRPSIRPGTNGHSSRRQVDRFERNCSHFSVIESAVKPAFRGRLSFVDHPMYKSLDLLGGRQQYEFNRGERPVKLMSQFDSSQSILDGVCLPSVTDTLP